MKNIFTIIICSLLSSAAVAQPLDTLITTAMANNPELKALFLEYRAQLERAPQVSELPDPEVSVGVSILPVETRLGPQWVRTGITQMFPWTGTLQARENIVLTIARARYERAEGLKQELVYQTKQAYFQLYELRRRRDIIRRNLRFFRGLEALSLAKVESGRATGADVLRVQLQIQELEQQLAILENRESTPLSTLNQVLNRPQGTPVTVADTLSAAALILDRTLVDSLIRSNHPALQRLSYEQEAARQEIELNNIDRKPTFGFGIDYIFTGKRNDAEPVNNGRDALGVRGSIQIPLFTNKYSAKEQEERLRIDALENQKLDLQQKYLAAVEKAYANYRNARLELELVDRQQSTLQSAIDILTTRYSNDGSSFDELLRLQIDQVNYDLRRLDAIVQSHLAKAEVERLTEFEY